MDLKIIEKKEEPLLSRTKIVSEMNFEAATPSSKEVKSKIASLLNADEKLIVVKNIYTDFGFKKADVSAYLYKDEKEMGIIEIKPKKAEAKEKKAETKEEKPQAKEEKQKESKEEKPQEKKAEAKPKAQEKPKDKAEK
jgi:ribosomal protein S24E